MNNLKTQNVLRAISLPFFNIAQLPTLFLLFFFFFFISSLGSLLPFSLPGVVSLSQALCSSDEYSNSLLHLDLSKNPGVLSGEDASVRKHNPSGNTNIHCPIYSPTHTMLLFLSTCSQNLYLFLSQPNCLVHLDLSGTDCCVDSVSI